jgi:hypothetical protein
MRAKRYAERAYKSGCRGVGPLSLSVLIILSNFACPTTCRYQIPYVDAYTVPDVVKVSAIRGGTLLVVIGQSDISVAVQPPRSSLGRIAYDLPPSPAFLAACPCSPRRFRPGCLGRHWGWLVMPVA